MAVSLAPSALERIRAREEDTFGAGAHIVDLARAALRPSGVRALETAVEQERQPLTSLIAVLGWSGTAAVDALMRAVGKPEVANTVADALRLIGRDAVPPLIERLLQGDRASRIAAALLLGGFGDTRAVPALIAALDGADAELTAAAAGALAQLGDAAALDSLLALFSHEQTMVRQTAIAAVNSIGADATAARIGPSLEHADPRIRASAVRVAGYFGFAEYASRILRLVDDPDEDVRRAAIEQLPIVDDPRALTRLIDAVTSETARVRAAATHALRHADGTVATDVLARALEDEDPWVRYFAADAIGGRAGIEAAPALTQLAQSDPAAHVRIAALRALTQVDSGIAGEIAAPLVDDSNPEVAAEALTAVASGSHPDADDLLEKAIRSGDPFMRRAAARALAARSTPRAAEVLVWAAALDDPPDLPRLLIDSLARMAASDDAHGRSAAVKALINLATAAETREAALHAIARLPERVVPDLSAALQSSATKTQLVAVDALARMRHPRASEALRMALRDKDAAVRRAAVAAFGRLGTGTAAADVARLSISDPDPRVRRLAEAMCRRHRWQERER